MSERNAQTKEPSSKMCVCGHVASHHNKRDSVYAGLMADYKVVWRCGFGDCGCPNYTKAQVIGPADLQGRIDRTTEYVEALLALDNLGSDLRVVCKAVRDSLRTPAPSTGESRG